MSALVCVSACARMCACTDFAVACSSTSPAPVSPAREEEEEGRAAALVVGGLLSEAVCVQKKKQEIK